MTSTVNMNEAFSFVLKSVVSFVSYVMFLCMACCFRISSSAFLVTSCSHEGAHRAALNNSHSARAARHYACRPVTSQNYVIWLSRAG